MNGRSIQALDGQSLETTGAIWPILAPEDDAQRIRGRIAQGTGNHWNNKIILLYQG